MKKYFGLTAKLAFAVLAGALALAAPPASAGIKNTKHNLGSTGAGANKANDTGEVCVFCHTPHAADNSAPVPLWNKKLGDGTGYTTYPSTSSSLDGSILSTVGSISLACLSCHDGTQAMDNLINAPGSGGYSATGGGAAGLGYTWALGGRVDADGKLTNSATTLAMLGTDLSNDHPIGIQYCGGGQTTASPAGACVDKDFVAPQTGLINSNRVWWVDTTGGTAGARDKSDMILYGRSFAGTVGPSVECGSCHDPHVEEGTGAPAAGATFLRIANTGSAVCLACHNK